MSFIKTITARSRLTWSALLALSAVMSYAQAGNVSVKVTDANGQPLADAAVYLEATGKQTLPKAVLKADIEQKARTFAPLVTVVQVGSEVSFPNNDTVRHHVYSFSMPKVFELKLYSGVPGVPVVFDKPGTVVVGCNIHDRMVAYIHVVDTPYFARTDAAGMARIENVVAGKFTLKSWHYLQADQSQIQSQAMVLTAADATASVRVTVTSPTPR